MIFVNTFLLCQHNAQFQYPPIILKIMQAYIMCSDLTFLDDNDYLINKYNTIIHCISAKLYFKGRKYTCILTCMPNKKNSKFQHVNINFVSSANTNSFFLLFLLELQLIFQCLYYNMIFSNLIPHIEFMCVTVIIDITYYYFVEDVQSSHKEQLP